MPINRRELLTASVAGAAILRQGRKGFAVPPGNIQVAIDAAKSGKPIDPMIFAATWNRLPLAGFPECGQNRDA